MSSQDVVNFVQQRLQSSSVKLSTICEEVKRFLNCVQKAKVTFMCIVLQAACSTLVVLFFTDWAII